MVTHDLLRVTATTSRQHTLLGVRASGLLSSEKFHTLLRVRGSGAVDTQYTHDLIRVRASGEVALALDTIDGPRELEPTKSEMYSATPIGFVPESYVWRRISGPAATIAGTGKDVVITAPPVSLGETLVIGVTATKDARTTEERVLAIYVLPATFSIRQDSGSVKVPGAIRTR